MPNNSNRGRVRTPGLVITFILLAGSPASGSMAQAGFDAPLPPASDGRPALPLPTDSSLWLNPARSGTELRQKEQCKALRIVPPWGIGLANPQVDPALTGFFRDKEAPRCWLVRAYRSGFIFDLSAIPERSAIRRATLHFAEVDTRVRSGLIRKGEQCWSAISSVAMLSPSGLEQWRPGVVDAYADTNYIKVSLPNAGGVNTEADVTRFVQNAESNRNQFNNMIGIVMLGHREKLDKPGKTRECLSGITNIRLRLELESGG